MWTYLKLKALLWTSSWNSASDNVQVVICNVLEAKQQRFKNKKKERERERERRCCIDMANSKICLLAPCYVSSPVWDEWPDTFVSVGAALTRTVPEWRGIDFFTHDVQEVVKRGIWTRYHWLEATPWSEILNKVVCVQHLSLQNNNGF